MFILMIWVHGNINYDTKTPFEMTSNNYYVLLTHLFKRREFQAPAYFDIQKRNFKADFCLWNVVFTRPVCRVCLLYMTGR